MTYEKLKQANELIKTTDIKGKAYAEVPQRIKAFRSVCPNGCIVTELLSNENGVCVFKASVYDDEHNLLGTGHAYEKEGSTFINKTSYIENCETSATGRALGVCGFGSDTSIASFEEVANAVLQQKQEKTKNTKLTTNEEFQAFVSTATAAQIAIIRKACNEDEIDKLCVQRKVDRLEDLTAEQAEKVIGLLEKAGKIEA